MSRPITNIAIQDKEEALLPYRICTKAKHEKWQDSDTCVINISMGNPYHEDVKLNSLLNWAHKRFKKTIINLGDALHRYNLINYNCSSWADAYEKAVSLGDQWLTHNASVLEPYIKQGEEVFKIHRWNEWLQSPQYDELFTNIRNYYQRDFGLQEAVKQDIERFTKRNSEKLNSDVHLCKKSESYLLEEATVYTLIARKYQATRVYPAPDLNIMQYLSLPFIPAQISGLDKAIQVQVKFYKRKSTKQQTETQNTNSRKEAKN